MLQSPGENGAERPSSLDEIRMMIAEGENEGWHHCGVGTIERDHYDSLLNIERRMSNAQATVQRTVYTTRQGRDTEVPVGHGSNESGYSGPERGRTIEPDAGRSEPDGHDEQGPSGR